MKLNGTASTSPTAPTSTAAKPGRRRLHAGAPHAAAVRRRVAAGRPTPSASASAQRAAAELAQPAALATFRRWLDAHDCYVFTINGFPYGSFHGTRVKEQVYAPDWSTPERLAYTQQLFELLVQLVPAGVAGSVSTVPAPSKAGRRRRSRRGAPAIFANVTAMRPPHRRTLGTHRSRSAPRPRAGAVLLLETTAETVDFFNAGGASDPRRRRGGPVAPRRRELRLLPPRAWSLSPRPVALDRLAAAGLRLSKLHLSSALRVKPDAAGRAALAAFVEPTYLHQVVVGNGHRRWCGDATSICPTPWPTPSPRGPTTSGACIFTCRCMPRPGRRLATPATTCSARSIGCRRIPAACQHAEMETYTWEVLPPALRSASRTSW
jgi:hypothetical protein